jgi:hypothetical protein
MTFLRWFHIILFKKPKKLNLMDIEVFSIARFEPASFFSTQISIHFSNSSISDALDRLCFFIDYCCLLKFPCFPEIWCWTFGSLEFGVGNCGKFQLNSMFKIAWESTNPHLFQFASVGPWNTSKN